MRRTAALLFTLLVLIAALASGCTPSETDIKMAELDDLIHDMESEISTFYLTGSSITSPEVRGAVARMEGLLVDIERLSTEVEGMDPAESVATFGELKTASDGLTDPLDSQEIMAVVVPPLEAFADALERLHESGGFKE